MENIILYYKYVTLEDPEAIRTWQLKLCTDLGLKGRIILGTEGINGTLGGSKDSTTAYLEIMRNHPLFCDIDFKESPGYASHFSRLKISIKPEIVRLGVDTQKITAQNGGIHLTPEETHALLANPPENLVIIDTRNSYESAVGTFTNAVVPNTQTFREFPAYVDNNQELIKDKTVLMFCTGGIRCERASAYVKSKELAKVVYQIKGGIHRYIEQFPDGFFRGKNYVFDGRVTMAANDDVIATCYRCGISYDEYINCINASCNKQLIACPPCVQELENTCSSQCNALVKSGSVRVRIVPAKTPAATTAS